MVESDPYIIILFLFSKVKPKSLIQLVELLKLALYLKRCFKNQLWRSMNTNDFLWFRTHKYFNKVENSLTDIATLTTLFKGCFHRRQKKHVKRETFPFAHKVTILEQSILKRFFSLFRYNNNTYTIDEVKFDAKPTDTFAYRGGEIRYFVQDLFLS